jgi:hypothetical protein
MSHPLRASRLVAAALAALATPLVAQVTPTGPFVGTHQEGFEAVTSAAAPCAGFDVFGGVGTYCGLSGSAPLISSGWGFSCSIAPYAGLRFTASASAGIEYNFTTPISRFGGYFGTNSPSSGAQVNFYDAAGALIQSVPATIPNDCNWYWQGWDIAGSGGAARVEVIGNYSSGGFIDMDDMEIDTSPALSLVGTPDSVSLSSGGTQVLAMDVADALAGKSYMILGSATGTAPGIPYGGALVPLNLDSYLIFTVVSPNSPLLAGSAGLLNSLGQATANFIVPPLSDPSLAGLTLNHAGIVLDLVSGSFVIPEVTNAYGVLLTP